jgi:hypothetical protein
VWYTGDEKLPNANGHINSLINELVVEVFWVCEEQADQLIVVVDTRQTDLRILNGDKDTLLK